MYISAHGQFSSLSESVFLRIAFLLNLKKTLRFQKSHGSHEKMRLAVPLINMFTCSDLDIYHKSLQEVVDHHKSLFFFHVFSPPAVVVGSGEDFFVLKVTAKRDVDENNRSKSLLMIPFVQTRLPKTLMLSPMKLRMLYW